MALDVYVMPLWRFKAGLFASPLQRMFGRPPSVVTVGGSARSKRGLWDRLFNRRPTVDSNAAHRQAVKAIRRAVEQENGVPISWEDDGEEVYTEQGHFFPALRAYARWLDLREQMPAFEPCQPNRYYDHPVWKLPLERSSFPHLVDHDCHGGYHLPCDFPRLVQVEPYTMCGYFPANRSVGSSPRLLRELERVGVELGKEEGNDKLGPIWSALQQLKEVAELSIRHKLPIIYHG